MRNATSLLLISYCCRFQLLLRASEAYWPSSASSSSLSSAFLQVKQQQQRRRHGSSRHQFALKVRNNPNSLQSTSSLRLPRRLSRLLYSSSRSDDEDENDDTTNDQDNMDVQLGFLHLPPLKTMTSAEEDTVDRSSLRQQIGTVESVVVEEDNDGEDEGNSLGGRVNYFSKIKWKKKSYLMMQDVRKEMKKNPKRAPKRAEDMVLRLQGWYNEVKDGAYVIDEEEDEECLLRYMQSTLVQVYNLWIHTLARSGQAGGGKLAEDILIKMKANHIPPNEVTYSSIIDAYGRCPSDVGRSSAQATEDFLFRSLQSGSGESLDSSLTFDSILNVWAQEGTMESAERAQIMLYTMEEWDDAQLRPTKHSYATVMNAWAKIGSTEAAEKAEAMLSRMIHRAKVEKQNMKTALAKTKKGSKNSRYQVVRPDIVVFNACINAWSTSRDPRAGQKALESLETMNDLSASDGDEYDVRPDIITYNTVLTCLSRCGDKNAGPKAEKIVKELEKMQQLSDDEDKRGPTIEPNTITYNTVLHCWAQSKLPSAASRAEKVLEYMIQSNNPAIAPDAYSFNCVMDALAKSKEPNKGLRAREWLDRQSDLHRGTRNPALKPTPVQYNTVLNACAFSSMGTTLEERREALKIAVSTFSSMSPRSSPSSRNAVVRDTVTYGNMMKCFTNLVPRGDTRSRMALTVFQECCMEGLVGTLVWNEVRLAVPAKLIKDASRVKGHVGTMEVVDLPRPWWENNHQDKLVSSTKGTSGRAGRQSKKERNPDVSANNIERTRTRSFIVEQSFASDKDM